MIKVSNGKCIRRISRKSLQASRTRNLIAIFAIALTSMMFTALFTVAISLNDSFQQANFRMAGGDGHGSFKDITEEQMEELKKDSLIKSAGGRLLVGFATGEDFLKIDTEVSYMEPEEVPHYFCQPTHGSLPEEGTNQAMTDTRVLNLLGVEAKVGESFTVTYNLGVENESRKQITETFILSGWWEYDEASIASHIVVPRSYAEKVLEDYKKITENEENSKKDTTGTWTMGVLFKNSLNIDKNMERVLENHGYQSTDSSKDNYIKYGVNWGYSASQFSEKADPLTVVTIAALLLLIIFTGYLIIYNVFQISVTNDIQFYGLLKTIGTTGKQIKRMIRYQAMFLSMIGVPLGLLLGFLIGAKLTPVIMKQLKYSTTVIQIHPVIFIGAALFSVFTVIISCRKPGKIAAKVSPVEASKYTDIKMKEKKKNKKASLFSMAWANMARNKRKTILVMISLSLSVVLLNLCVMFTNGFSMDKYLKSKVVTDFIFGDATYFNVGSGGFQISSQAVTEDLIQTINQQKGIKESGRIYGQTSDIQQLETPEEFKNSYKEWENDEETLNSLLESAEKAADGKVYGGAQIYGMESLPLQYLEVINGDITSLMNPDSHSIAEVSYQDDYGKIIPESHRVKVGDTINLRYVDEWDYYDSDTGESISEENLDDYQGNYGWRAKKSHEEEYTVVAEVTIPSTESYRYRNVGASVYVMGSEAFIRDSGTKDIMTYLFNMENDEAMKAMDIFLDEYTNKVQTLYDYESKLSYVDEFQGLQNMFFIMGGVISGIVAIVGILNYLNAILTGILSRKREFAMLQSIGMTGKQLKVMLILEGLLYTMIAIVVSFFLSLLLGFLVGKMLENVFWFFDYKVTILPVIFMTPVFAVLGVLVPWLVYRVLAKDTIVERLRIL